jgi:hypothetical protein
MKQKKKPLQVYLLDQERNDYNRLCDIKGVTATSELRAFIIKQIKKGNGLLK